MPAARVDAPRAEVVGELFSGLLRLSRALRSRSADWTSASADLSRGDLVVLGVVHDRGQVRPGQIAAALNVDPSVVSRQLATLERHDLITRGTDPADGRAELIALTTTGREQMLRARAAMHQVLAGRLQGWDAEDIARAAATVEDLAAVLQPAENSPEPSPQPNPETTSRTTEPHA
jgi:DNA-binding MarR family transcriptional regulator